MCDNLSITLRKNQLTHLNSPFLTFPFLQKKIHFLLYKLSFIKDFTLFALDLFNFFHHFLTSLHTGHWHTLVLYAVRKMNIFRNNCHRQRKYWICKSYVVARLILVQIKHYQRITSLFGFYKFHSDFPLCTFSYNQFYFYLLLL